MRYNAAKSEKEEVIPPGAQQYCCESSCLALALSAKLDYVVATFRRGE